MCGNGMNGCLWLIVIIVITTSSPSQLVASLCMREDVYEGSDCVQRVWTECKHDYVASPWSHRGLVARGGDGNKYYNNR